MVTKKRRHRGLLAHLRCPPPYEKGNLVRKRGKVAADTDILVPESEVPLNDAYLRRTLCIEQLKRANDFEIYLSGWR
jgi:hypothetical protein